MTGGRGRRFSDVGRDSQMQSSISSSAVRGWTTSSSMPNSMASMTASSSSRVALMVTIWFIAHQLADQVLGLDADRLGEAANGDRRLDLGVRLARRGDGHAAGLAAFPAPGARVRRVSSSSTRRAEAGTGEVTRRSPARSLRRARRPARSAAEPEPPGLRLSFLFLVDDRGAAPGRDPGAGRGRGARPDRRRCGAGRRGAGRKRARHALDGRPAARTARRRRPHRRAIEVRRAARTSSGPASRPWSSISPGAGSWATGRRQPGRGASRGPRSVWRRPPGARAGRPLRRIAPRARRRRRLHRQAVAVMPTRAVTRARPAGSSGEFPPTTCSRPGFNGWKPAGRSPAVGRRLDEADPPGSRLRPACPAMARTSPGAGRCRDAACAPRAGRRLTASRKSRRAEKAEPATLDAGRAPAGAASSRAAAAAGAERADRREEPADRPHRGRGRAAARRRRPARRRRRRSRRLAARPGRAHRRPCPPALVPTLPSSSPRAAAPARLTAAAALPATRPLRAGRCGARPARRLAASTP